MSAPKQNCRSLSKIMVKFEVSLYNTTYNVEAIESQTYNLIDNQ